VYYEKDGIGLKPIEENDLSVILTHRNDSETWANLTHTLPLLEHNQKKWLEGLGNNNLYFLIKAINGVEFNSWLGLARINEIDYVNRNAQIGLDIFKQVRGKGYGKKSFPVIVDYSFEILNMHRLWLMVMDGNSPAIKIYRNIGFKEEGRLREHLWRKNSYKDYIVMGLLREEWEANVAFKEISK
jgi:RimJ/RimL family protein N-acetyltransferase